MVTAERYDSGTGQASSRPPLIIAHRGASGRCPENTWPAFAAAAEDGADFVEIDVQRSADGELVVFHDRTIERTTDATTRFPGRPSYAVPSFTLAELRQLDAGSWFGPEYAGERVLSLRELLAELDDDLGLLLEMKPLDGLGLGADVAAVLDERPDVVGRRLEAGRLVVQSFDVEDARTFHKRRSDVPVGLLYGVHQPPTPEALDDAAGWAAQVNTDHAMVMPELVADLHDRGLACCPWTVNEEADQRRLIELGVDGLITDFPGRVSTLLRAGGRV